MRGAGYDPEMRDTRRGFWDANAAFPEASVKVRDKNNSVPIIEETLRHASRKFIEDRD